MKRIFTTLLLILASTLLFAQIPTTNLRLWLRADAGLTTTTGSVINSNWTDQSSNAISVVRFGSPILVPNAINGKPAVRFPTNGNYFNTSNTAVTNLTGISYYAVTKFPSTSTEVFNKMGQYGLHALNSGSARFFTNSINNNELQYNNAGIIGNYFIYSGIYNSSNISGALNTTVSSNVNYSSPIPAGGTLYIGGGYNFWSPSLEIAELIIYNDALNTSQQDQVYNYLAAKYNLGINPNAPTITSFGTLNSFEPSYFGTRVAQSGFASLSAMSRYCNRKLLRQ